MRKRASVPTSTGWDARPFCAFEEELGFAIEAKRSRSSEKAAGSPEGQRPLGAGFPIGARSPCWPGIPKGTAFPWPEESKETGGFVALDLARKV
ncbi:MAG: hypothetical protein IKM73_14030 [Acidaminococcaceae bacterium]|nr:hypothetical protein [Acidaminococcaceae bacterium]